VTPFAQITSIGANTMLTSPAAVPNPANPPNPRFALGPVEWISVAGAANLFAFARSSVRMFSGTSPVFDAVPAFAWTLIELSPLPFFAPKTLLRLKGGLPVMYVLLSPNASTPINNDAAGNKVRGAGELVATTAGAVPSAWFGVCMQDRIMRDAALWSQEIADAIISGGDDPGTWAAFASSLQGLGTPARPIIQRFAELHRYDERGFHDRKSRERQHRDCATGCGPSADCI
jgi:hypothetical protein